MSSFKSMRNKIMKIQAIPGERPLVAISGLPGLGAVGIGAASSFVSKGKSTLIYQLLIKSSFSNFIVNENGIISPSVFNLFYVTLNEVNKPLLVFLGSFQPQSMIEQYTLAELLLKVLKKLGIEYVFTLGGFQTLKPLTTRSIFFVPNDTLTLRLSMSHGVKIAGGQITGAAGLIAGLSKFYGFKGGVFLAETDGRYPDQEASQALFEKMVVLLNKIPTQ